MARSSPIRHPLGLLSILSATPRVLSFPSSSFSQHHAHIVNYLPSSCRINSRRNNRAQLHVLRATPITSTSWKPCAQPRFDEFAESTVGPWITTSSSQSPSTGDNAARTVREVEEVMRSCGGAIQGIRELPLSLIFETTNDENSNLEERTYHNRADGGFVYADDGSYSAGPEQWDWNDLDEVGEGVSKNDDADLLMASLAFPGRRRMWLTAKVSEASPGMASKCTTGESDDVHRIDAKVLELSRPVSTLKNSDECSNDPHNTIELNPSELPSINWKVIQRVRMPNANQPWSLARAKWEKYTIESDEESEEYNANTVGDKKLGPMVACAYVEPFSENRENDIFGDMVATDAKIFHMLAVCSASKFARSVVRCYAADGSLKSVAFLEGSLDKILENK